MSWSYQNHPKEQQPPQREKDKRMLDNMTNKTYKCQHIRQLCVAFVVSVLMFCKGVSGSSSLCLLCKKGVMGLQRPHYFVNKYGKTCAQVMVQMSQRYSSDEEQCSIEKNKYNEMCCGESEPEPIEQEPPSVPVYNGKITCMTNSVTIKPFSWICVTSFLLISRRSNGKVPSLFFML